MADIKLRILHPTNGGSVEVTLDDTMRPGEVISELVAADFIPPNSDGYLLSDEARELPGDKALADSGVVSGTVIRIDPGTLAGGGIPGVHFDNMDRLTLQDVQRSPGAVAVLLHMYRDLQDRFDDQARELRQERRNSEGRLIAALLLLVSQVVLALGVNLLTDDRSGAIVVLSAGSLIALLAIYFSFVRPRSDSIRKQRSTPANSAS